jgi:L-aspartate oxidase
MDRDAVRGLMWRNAGLFRSREGLLEAVATLERVSTTSSSRTAEESRHRNLLTVARLIARAALRREESRGGHYREDFPQRNDQQWKIHLVDSGAA